MEQKIRKGGLQTPEGFRYELSGGNLALDLANTVDNRPTEVARELIPEVSDLLSWARQAELLDSAQHKALEGEAQRDGAAARRALRRIVEVRECLFQLFSSLADNREPRAEVLSEWNRHLRECLGRYETVPVAGGLVWRLRPDQRGFDQIIWPIVHSALELLTGPGAGRIRRCAGERCDWLFVDTSKRGNRRWCDMTVCGNRAKARRHYERSKAGTRRTSRSRT